MFLFTACVSLVSGILFGLFPAVKLSPGREAELVSHSSSAGDGKTQASRNVFVVCEFALSVVLLIGAGLLIRSFAAALAVDHGFQAQRALTAQLRFHTSLQPAERLSRYEETIERINQLPGVHAAGAISTMFWTGEANGFALRAVEGKPREDSARWTPLAWTTVRGRYFEAAGVPLLKGRYFSRADTAGSPPVAIINETIARRYWPNEDVIGRKFKGFDFRGRNDEWVTIVGLVKDVRSRGPEQSPMGQIFLPQAQSLDETENLVVQSDQEPGHLASALRHVVGSIDKTAVLMGVSTLERQIEHYMANRRFQVYLLSFFALVALLLAGIGVFATMHYAVIRRTREMGVRIALGARGEEVTKMVVREGLTVAAVGILLGVAGSALLMRTVQSLFFGVGPTDPVTFVAVAIVLSATALFACYLPARRAARVDPAVALRAE